MPHRAPRPCRRNGCPEVVTSKDGWCAIHRQEENKNYNDKKRPRYHAVLYGSLRWKRLRMAHLSTSPFCKRCGAVAELVHHRTPHNGDPILFYAPDNLESLCTACHNREHERGAVQGRGAGKKSGAFQG